MKNIVVTGASSGLGKHISMKLIEEGYEVIGLSRTVPDDCKFKTLKCDVGDFNNVKQCFKEIRKTFDVHALINAAGIASMNLFIMTPAYKMEQIIKTNVLGTMFCSQEALKIFARQKDSRNVILNFSTIAVSIALKGESVYVASKAAVEGFSRTIAKEAADFNCNVNTIAPGPVDTKLIKGINRAQIDKIIEQQTIQNKAKKSDIFDICKLLLSEEAKNITGQLINVKGV